MTKDERIKELETITMRLFDMVHEGNLIELQIEANELHPRIVNNGVLDDVSDTLIAWEQFKKANWYESEAIDVEKMLIDKFQAIYGR